MTPKEQAAFIVDESKCIQCGRYVNVCAGMVLPYARGVQKGQIKVHRWTEQSGGQLNLL